MYPANSVGLSCAEFRRCGPAASVARRRLADGSGTAGRAAVPALGHAPGGRGGNRQQRRLDRCRAGNEAKLACFIEANGAASKAEIRSSSGYDRLDQTALQTVLRWRYVPGKRNGVAEAMWFNVPINFVLE